MVDVALGIKAFGLGIEADCLAHASKGESLCAVNTVASSSLSRRSPERLSAIFVAPTILYPAAHQLLRFMSSSVLTTLV